MLNHLHGKSTTTQPAGSMAGWGKIYDGLVGLMTFGTERRLRQATLDLAEIRSGERILEVGCGTGTLTLAAQARAGAGSQVCGIDVAPDMIETARGKAKRVGAEVQFQVGRIEAIPYPSGQFDLVLSSLMLHHVPGQAAKEQGLAEIIRVLRPGGRLLIVDAEPPKSPHVRGLVELFVGRTMFSHTVRDFVPLLERAGFTQIETGPTKLWFLAYLRGRKS